MYEWHISIPAERENRQDQGRESEQDERGQQDTGYISRQRRPQRIEQVTEREQVAQGLHPRGGSRETVECFAIDKG